MLDEIERSLIAHEIFYTSAELKDILHCSQSGLNCLNTQLIKPRWASWRECEHAYIKAADGHL